MQRELLFKPVLDIPDYVPQDSDYPDVDSIGCDVIDNYTDTTGYPRKTTGDGNCLYNAVSILLTGDESLSVHLRYHTCLKLVMNQDTYLLHPLRSTLVNLTESYGTTCLETATPGKFSNAWNLIAL